METSNTQTSLFTEEALMSSRVDSPARTQVSPNSTVRVNKGYKVAEQASFMKWSEPSARSDQSMSLPRTWQTFLKLTEEQTLAQYSPNYPDWGIMQNGEFVVRQKSVRPITAPGCIWLLTPTASQCNRITLSSPMYTRRHHRSAGDLTEQLYRLIGGVPGKLNPRLSAWIMGYPQDWLENKSTDTETQ